jgi:peptidoglycan-associated lipoprotein
MKRMLLLMLFAAVISVLAFSVSGCAKKKVTAEEEMGAAAEETALQPGDAGYEKIYEESMASKEESLEAQAAMEKEPEVLEGRTSAPLLPIYFDFDKSNIREDQRARIVENATFLSENKAVRVRIEGNCDERGTNEYNMALGERRANSAKKYLVNLGIHEDRMHTISYGEEKPLLHGHDEYSWAQNRRDDFVVVK